MRLLFCTSQFHKAVFSHSEKSTFMDILPINKNKNRFTIYTHAFFDITGAPLYTLPYFVGYNFRAEWSIKGFFVHVGLVRFFYNTFFTSLLV